MLKFAVEPIAEVWNEALPLVRDNYRETGLFPAEEFNPNPLFYQQLEQAGRAPLFTARETGKLKGYALFPMSGHMHFPGLLWAMQDVLYVAPEARGIGAARFMLWQERQLEERGAQVILRHVTEQLDYSRSLLRMDYRPAERSFVRRVG